MLLSKVIKYKFAELFIDSLFDKILKNFKILDPNVINLMDLTIGMHLKEIRNPVRNIILSDCRILDFGKFCFHDNAETIYEIKISYTKVNIPTMKDDNITKIIIQEEYINNPDWIFII
jgi:hypothetical protein